MKLPSGISLWIVIKYISKHSKKWWSTYQAASITKRRLFLFFFPHTLQSRQLLLLSAKSRILVPPSEFLLIFPSTSTSVSQWYSSPFLGFDNWMTAAAVGSRLDVVMCCIWSMSVLESGNALVRDSLESSKVPHLIKFTPDCTKDWSKDSMRTKAMLSKLFLHWRQLLLTGLQLASGLDVGGAC